MSARAQRLLKAYTRFDASQPITERISPHILGMVFVILVLLAWGMALVIGFESAVAILAVIGFISAVVGIRNPAIGLLGIGILVTLDPINRNLLFSGGLLRWNTLNYWLIIVILLNIPFILRINDLSSRLLEIFLLFIFLELFISQQFSNGLQDIINITATFGLLIYFVRIIHEERYLFWLGVVNGVLAAVGGLIFFLQVDVLPYINPNSWAIFPLTAIISICLGFPFAKNYRRGKLILIVLAAINFAWIFLSGSRGNMLIGLCCMLYLILQTRSFSWITMIIVIGTLLGYWLSIQFINQQSYAVYRINKLFNPSYTLAERTSGRSNIAQAGWDLFLENPFGVGTGGFRYEVSSIDIVRGREIPAHSGWIKTLAENGFLGILLLVAFVTSFTVVGWKTRSQGFFLIGLLVTIAFSVGFLSKEFQGKELWFLAAGAMALLNKDQMIRYLQKGGRYALVKNRDHWRKSPLAEVKSDRKQ